MSANTASPKKRVIKPIIISNDRKITLTNFKLNIQPYKEDIVYSAKNCDFLKGDSQDVLIVNRVNLVSKSCRTVAKCTCKGVTVETSSDAVTSVIGQKNYETVLSALSSVFNEETRVRGILALLTSGKKKTTATQTDGQIMKKYQESFCQTFDTRSNMILKEKQRKRLRRQPLQPYVVTESVKKIKKLVIDVNSMPKSKHLDNEDTEDMKEDEPNFPDLNIDDDNMSTVSNISLSSIPSVPGILDNPEVFFNAIDKVTDNTLNPYTITLKDGSKIMIPTKPEDDFHIATPDILKNVTHEEKLKLIWHQAYVDFKLCLQQDDDGYYPLHIAVLHSDNDLVRRLCAAVKSRRESVDIQGGPDKLTALHMAIRQNCPLEITKILLENGADPLACDRERRSALHLAADANNSQLETIVQHCDKNARSILRNNPKLWRQEYEREFDYRKLARRLFQHVSEMFDEQGCTPLMLSSGAGLPQHTFLLASRAGRLVDAASPTSGHTALYRVVADACHQLKVLHDSDRLTVKPPDNYLKTIEILVEHGADPSVENHAGASVNTLLTEFNISSISMTIANKMTAMKHGKQHTGNLDMILYKQDDGSIDYTHISKTPLASYERTNDRFAININDIEGIDKVAFPAYEKKFKGKEGEIKEETKDVNVIDKESEIKENNDVKVTDANTKKGPKQKIKIINGKLIHEHNDNASITTAEKIDDNVKLKARHNKDTNETGKDGERFRKRIILRRVINDVKLVRSGKERKTDNVVVVENVPVKKTFAVPNILRAASSKIGKPNDIVITSKAGEKIVISTKYETDEIKVKKRKIDSE